MLHTLRFLWCLPLTAYGLPLWLAVWFQSRFLRQKELFARIQIVQGAPVFVAYAPWLGRLMARHPMGVMQAVTLGCCVFARDEETLSRTWAHECVHVRQALRWGIFFPLAYLAASFWARHQGGCPYADNVFEREALQAESCNP
jgi:hypothetical protein